MKYGQYSTPCWQWGHLTAMLLATAVTTTAFSPLGAIRRPSTRLLAAGDAPQYDKIDMILVDSQNVGKGSCLLTMATKDDTTKLDYHAGHVLALEMEAPETITTERIRQDAARNGGWMRGPYTVTRFQDDKLDVLVKVVGEKTNKLSNSPVGTPLKIGGKFKVPIVEGIVNVAGSVRDDDNDTEMPDDLVQPTRRVVLLATGVGVGPCMGAVEEWIDDFSSTLIPSSVAKIDLVASYRTEPEVVCREYLDELSEKSKGLFSWQSVISSVSGRVSDSDENLRNYVTSNSEVCSISETHYHLIGNGQLVQEWQEGLAQAGVPSERVTTEIYFNSKAEKDSVRISRIAQAIKTAAAVPETVAA